MLIILFVTFVLSVILIGIIYAVIFLVMGKLSPGYVIGGIFCGIVIIVLTLRFTFPCWPIGLRHLCYVAKNGDIHKPVIVKSFEFTTTGYTDTFVPILKYWNEYSVGICLNGGNFPEEYQYHGKIRVEFFHENKLIDTYISNEIEYHKWWRTDEGGKLQLVNDKVGLVTFDMAKFRKYRDGLKIKVTVLEPDEELKIYDGNLCLYIGIDRLL